MRAIITLFFVLASTSLAQAELKKNTIITTHQFMVLSDVDSAEITVFLSYAGLQFNQCGIQIRANNFQSGETLDSVLAITMDVLAEVGEVTDAALVAKVLMPEMASFGEFFTIKSKTHATIAEAIQSLSTTSKVDAIVENLPCQQ